MGDLVRLPEEGEKLKDGTDISSVIWSGHDTNSRDEDNFQKNWHVEVPDKSPKKKVSEKEKSNNKSSDEKTPSKETPAKAKETEKANVNTPSSDKKKPTATTPSPSKKRKDWRLRKRETKGNTPKASPSAAEAAVADSPVPRRDKGLGIAVTTHFHDSSSRHYFRMRSHDTSS